MGERWATPSGLRGAVSNSSLRRGAACLPEPPNRRPVAALPGRLAHAARRAGWAAVRGLAIIAAPRGSRVGGPRAAPRGEAVGPQIGGRRSVTDGRSIRLLP